MNYSPPSATIEPAPYSYLHFVNPITGMHTWLFQEFIFQVIEFVAERTIPIKLGSLPIALLSIDFSTTSNPNVNGCTPECKAKNIES